MSRNGRLVAHGEFETDGAEFEERLATLAPEAWSPSTTKLYDLKLEVLRDGAAVDAVERTIGFRRFEAKGGKLLLNGEPFFLVGALDQDWHPEQECRPPTPKFLEERFVRAKAMGLNTLRCHVKIPDRLYFDLADRLGLVVWLDMPYMGFLAPATRGALREVFRKSVSTHGSHPSICVWTLFNEGWGIELDDNPDDRRWLIETFDEAKALVPESLLVDNSPCFPRNYHLKTDIEDFHWYNGFPHQNEAFAATTRAFAARAPWAWSPHGDAVARGDEPLVCSEFGVWGLPHPREILEKDGSEPWWFESGHDWNLSAAYPHGIESRFRDAGLQPIFGDVDGFVERRTGLSVPRAQISDRDLALGAGDLGLRDHRTQRHAVGIERAHGRFEPPARLRRVSRRAATPVARDRARRPHGAPRRREGRGLRPTGRRSRAAQGRKALVALRR